MSLMAKVKLIDNAKHWYKLWSVRLVAAGSAIIGAYAADPVLFNEITRHVLPNGTAYGVGLALNFAGLLARVIKQEKLSKANDVDSSRDN